MKKRLPTLVVFGGALLAGMFIFLWPYLFPPQKALDSDKDGYPDKIDKCPKEFSKTNNGCPEKEAKKGDDQDGDGYFAGFQKDASLQDNDDNDPCSPNKQCKLCDLDKDGLNFEQETQKASNPESPDSDGDGVKDGQDKCVNQAGVTETGGCPIILDAQLRRKGKTISWNPQIMSHASSLTIVVYDGENNEIDRIQNIFSGTSMKIRKISVFGHGSAKLICNLRNPKAVKINNQSCSW